MKKFTFMIDRSYMWNVGEYIDKLGFDWYSVIPLGWFVSGQKTPIVIEIPNDFDCSELRKYLVSMGATKFRPK
jgi:hypothetical protein